MCNLLALSAQSAVSFNESLIELLSQSEHDNPDGWGVVLYEKNDAYIYREPQTAADSSLAKYLKNAQLKTYLLLAHIRKATQGTIELRNTNPFSREVNGRLHSFIFNGDIPDVFKLDLRLGQFLPLGESDGEYAFCYLLDQLQLKQKNGKWQETAQLVQQLGDLFSQMGPTNFIYTDSLRIYAYASHRCIDNQTMTGLYYLRRQCGDETTNDVTILSSTKLSDEQWIALKSQQLLVIEKGLVLNNKR